MPLSNAELSIAGERAADPILDSIAAGVAHPSALYDAAAKAWSDFGSPGLSGFLRRVQKRLERSK